MHPNAELIILEVPLNRSEDRAADLENRGTGEAPERKSKDLGLRLAELP